MEKKIAMRVSFISIAVNVVLSLLKLIAGIVANSGAMVSDAVHSASDVLSTFAVIIGVNIAAKASDKDHQYGHDRMECVASVVLSVLLLFTGIKIGYDGILNIIKDASGEIIHTPGMLALVAAVVSIVTKEWMYWFTRAAAKKINSGALMADAWHHRSDALSSIGSFVGILGARLGYPVFDPIASVVICIMIVKAAYDIFKDSMDKMVDKACPQSTEDEIHAAIMTVDGVMGIDKLSTRLFGNKIYVDVEISADGTETLYQTHSIAESVHAILESEFPQIKHCMVHVNPYVKDNKDIQ